MYKLMIILKKPQHEEEFNRFYYNDFIPKVMNVEGLERIELATMLPAIGIIQDRGNTVPFDLQIEMYFQNREHFHNFLHHSEVGTDFQEKLIKYGEYVYTITWGQPEIISRPEIVSRYNQYVIQSQHEARG